ncbi:MAG: pyruvate kinase [Pseudomonadales bacterium]|nr:pyruvate kinase [Pseudomonadales bacterium]
MKRQTKIICTIGPATESFDMLYKLGQAGMNVVRLNMSHGSHESHAKIIKAVKTLNQKVKYPIPILLDTQGPEIRTGVVDSDLELKQGDHISVTVRGADVEQSSIHINYDELVDTLHVGDKITVDNGLINLEVLEKDHRILKCEVIDGGTLKSKRHVNLPGIKVNLPAITKKDHDDILFGIDQDIDFIALSFVREASDVMQLKQLIGSKAAKTKIIAKIEDQEGLRNIKEIIDVVDGVMVARGDLGVEIPFEDLPNVQRDIVRYCHQAGKRVIVATHLLESMIENPMPTRAEVTDVANAVYEGVDAIMLSGETTVGKYPIKCIETLDKIARQSEQRPGLAFHQELIKDAEKQHIAEGAVQLAESLQASGIIVITRRGIMAQYVTNCRPNGIPIFAFTNDSRTRRQLSLNRSTFAHRIAFSKEPERTLHNAFGILKDREGLSTGDRVVVVSDIIAGMGIEAIQVRNIPDEIEADQSS